MTRDRTTTIGGFLRSIQSRKANQRIFPSMGIILDAHVI
jgi:hypothetical protein